MGKRTSDFMALVAILGGAGLGLGLTSVYAQSRTERVPDADDSSVRVRVLRRSIIVEPGRIANSSADANVVRHALIVEQAPTRVMEGSVAPSRRMRSRVRTSRWVLRELERLRAQVEELRREAGELDELKELAEALEAVEALEDLDLGQNLTIDIFRSDDDERRRRQCWCRRSSPKGSATRKAMLAFISKPAR